MEGSTFDETWENDITVDLANKHIISENVPEDLTAASDTCKVIQ